MEIEVEDILKKRYNIIISLGTCCEVNFVLKKILNISSHNYPFDWLASYKFKDVLQSISEKFKCNETIYTIFNARYI